MRLKIALLTFFFISTIGISSVFASGMSASTVSNLIVTEGAKGFGLALLGILVAVIAIAIGVLIYRSGYAILRTGSITGVKDWYMARRNYRKRMK